MHTRSLSVLLALICGAAVGDAAPPGHVESYIMLRGDNNVTMRGEIHDIDHVRSLRQTPNERLVWLRVDGHDYVIRDPATIAQAEAIFKPVQQLGDEMGRVGGKQGELGGRQSGVGAQLGALGARMGELGAELGELGTRDPQTKAERKAIRKRKREIERQMHDLEDQMQSVQEQMTPLEAPMRELSKQMEALSKRMEVANKKANADLDALFARAIASGAAKRI
jgi:hypothetical protein